MGTPKFNAPYRMSALSVGANTIWPCERKDPAAPATSALCGGEHPASYIGCVIYKHLQQAQGKPITH